MVQSLIEGGKGQHRQDRSERCLPAQGHLGPGIDDHVGQTNAVVGVLCDRLWSRQQAGSGRQGLMDQSVRWAA